MHWIRDFSPISAAKIRNISEIKKNLDSFLDHGVGSSDYFHHYNFCITPNETPVNIDSWRSPAPIAFAVIRISLRLTFSRLWIIKGIPLSMWSQALDYAALQSKEPPPWYVRHFAKHLNTSLFCAESLCGKGVEVSEVFWKLLTLLLTQQLTRF